MKIAVWFSCGAASAVAAKLAVLIYGREHEVLVCNTPVAEEDADNRRFMWDVQAWLGQPIFTAIAKKYPESSAEVVWAKRKFMSSPYGAPCTDELKKQARREWEEIHCPDWHVLGFTSDEQKRHDRFTLTERSNVIPLLIQIGLTKSDCYTILQQQGIKPPRVYRMGYPNANCIGCVKATSATYWNLVRDKHPEVFARRAAQSRQLGVRLARNKGERVFLDELPADAVGRPLRELDFDCGIFCEEKPAATSSTSPQP